ncbi:hypothetical protein N9372_03665 [Alphaproteobacteria bacterium]|jgi:hypothetical protein|nr:hypothetical protein [Alphaproteobacteria bacterium]
MFRLLFLIALSLGLSSQAITDESYNINKIRNMDYDYNQMAIASEIIRKLEDKSNKLEIYDGHLFQPPSNLRKQISDATLEYYYLMTTKRPETRPNEYYIVQGSNNYEELEASDESHKKINAQMKQGTILSFLYYSKGKVVYDVLPPDGRFITSFNEESYFPSHSMGKSITSYLLGYAICNGYIGGINNAISNWPLMENTLYYGQPIINLLNMSAGDTNVIEEYSGSFIKTGKGIHSQPLIDAVENEDELKNTKPVENASYSYSNLTSDILFNYTAHRVGDKFKMFLDKFYKEKIGIKYPVYLWLNRLRNNAFPSVENLTAQGAWQYGISATRYDFLRIAISILNDWKNDTCEGKYLKDLYKIAVSTGYNGNWSNRRDGGYPKFNTATSKYAGQFYTSVHGMYEKNILVMDGADGQQIVINLDDERIVVISAGQANWYNTKKIAYDLIKSGKMKSGNWN